jgi:cytoskeleton protein RodZ
MTSLGQVLKEEREARNISIEEIASATKIVRRYIEALENDRFDIMPGGFFVKGIIRTYARTIGLNEEEVLDRYREAGIFGDPENKHRPVPKSESPPTPPPAPQPEPEPAVQPAPSPQPETREPAVLPTPPSEPSFLPAPKPRMAPEEMKRIIIRAAGGAFIVLAVAVLIIVWTSRRRQPGPVETAATPSVPTQAVVPPPQKPAVEPEPEPVVEKVWTGVTIEISFQAETWIQVYTDGVLKVSGLFPPGAKAQAQAAERLLIHVGNAGGFTFLLNGKPAKPLGRSGQVITDIKITQDNLKDFLQSEAPGQPGR